MNLENISENLKNLPDDQEKSILAIIDHKTEQDMEKVLNKFDVIKESMQAKMESMQAKMDSMQFEIHAIKDSMQSEIQSIRYFITIGFSIIGLLIVIVSIVLPIIFKFIR